MPVYRHLDSGKRFFFVHIPRTGGRFFERNLYDQHFGAEHDNIWNSIEDIEIAHAHRELYERHEEFGNLKKIPHIAIIRDPIEKFFSASIYLKRMYGPDIQEAMEDENQFFSMLKDFPIPEAINWYRPQVDFLSEKTHIWRFEDGLRKPFADWVSDILGIPFTINAWADYKTDPDEGINKLDKTPKLLDNVRQLVRRDIEQLYPQLDPSFQEGSKTKT